MELVKVIFVNDDPKLVIHPDSDQSKINQKVEELAKANYEKVKSMYRDYESYRDRYYWHTHIVKIEKI